jgi:hypothetical protein
MIAQPLVPDSRTLDEIYEAAKEESGTFLVAAGGDGKQLTRLRLLWVAIADPDSQRKPNGMPCALLGQDAFPT